MENKTVTMIVLLTLVFVLGSVLLSLTAILYTLPKEAYVKEGIIYLQFRHGKATQIPEAEVTYLDFPEQIPKLIRTNGTSIGRYHTGHYQDMKTKEKYHLFMYGSETHRAFKYKDEIYLVDFSE